MGDGGVAMGDGGVVVVRGGGVVIVVDAGTFSSWLSIGSSPLWVELEC